MKIFFDTEFYENGKTIELISIGLVREDDVVYYAETWHARLLCDQSDWLRANVLPHLIGTTKHKVEIQRDIVEFVGKDPEFWADYASYDWVVLCQLFGRMIDLPPGWPMFVRDIQQMREERGNPAMPKQATDEHNALADAKHCKDLYDFLIKQPVKSAA